MLFKALVLPEEGTRHGGGDDQHIEQGTANHAGGKQGGADDDQTDQGEQVDRIERQDAGQQAAGQEQVQAQHRVAQHIGFAKGGGLHVIRGAAFVLGAAHGARVGGVAQAFQQQAQAQQGGADQGHIQHALTGHRQRSDHHRAGHQGAERQQVADEGRADLPMVPERAGLDAVALHHVVQARGAAQHRQVTQDTGQRSGLVGTDEAAGVRAENRAEQTLEQGVAGQAEQNVPAQRRHEYGNAQAFA